MSQLSKRRAFSLSPRFHEADEMRMAESLILLSHSGGGICLWQTEYSPPTGQNLCYECSVCAKVFPSHQALKVHKSSHHPSTSTTSLDASAPILRAGLHYCSICHLNFPTDRALGCHMCKHYRGNAHRNIGAKCQINSFMGSDGSSGIASFSHRGGGGAATHSHGNVVPVH